MGERLLRGDAGQFGSCLASERPAGSRQDDPPHFRRTVDDGARQAFAMPPGREGLSYGRMLRVHGDDLARPDRRLPDEGASDDEGLLVGQGQRRSRPQRREGGRQADRTSDAVEDHVVLPRHGGYRRHRRRAGDDFRQSADAAGTAGRLGDGPGRIGGERAGVRSCGGRIVGRGACCTARVGPASGGGIGRKRLCEGCLRGRIGDRHGLRTELHGLAGKQIDVSSARSECENAEILRVPRDDVERLRTDGTGGPQKNHPAL